MVNDINQVALTGRLVKGAEVKYPRENFCVVTFTIASNENQKKGDQWEKRANYIDCSFSGNYAKALAPSMTKGRSITVTGKIHQDRWEKDGQKQSKIIIKVDNAKLGQLPNGKSDSSEPSVEEQPFDDVPDDSDPESIPF